MARLLKYNAAQVVDCWCFLAYRWACRPFWTHPACDLPGGLNSNSPPSDFVTEAEEAELLAAVDAHPWQSLAKRRVQHHGREFDYVTLDVGAQAPCALPSFLAPLVQRVQGLPGVPQDLVSGNGLLVPASLDQQQQAGPGSIRS